MRSPPISREQLAAVYDQWLLAFESGDAWRIETEADNFYLFVESRLYPRTTEVEPGSSSVAARNSGSSGSSRSPEQHLERGTVDG